MTDRPTIARRLVFHVGGYEPQPPGTAYRRFVREMRRFQATWSLAGVCTDPEVDADLARWRITTSGPDWQTETDYRVVRWDDIIDAGARQPMWRRLPLGLVAFADFSVGALWGYLRQNWRYAAFFLYPFVLLCMFCASAVLVGVLVAKAVGSSLAGGLVGILALAALLRWPGSRLHLPLLLDDWIFSRRYLRGGDPVLAARLDTVARELVAAERAGDTDEILIVGHSLGAVLALDVIDRGLQLEPGLGQNRPVAFLSVGSSILKIGMHRGSSRFRRAVERVASAPGVFWAEYQALIDVMNFYKTDPVGAMGLATAKRPTIRVVRLRRMFKPEFYRRTRYNFFRIHRQFVSGNDCRAAYDYFMFACGPFPAERLVHSHLGAMPDVAEDGALVTADPPEDPLEQPARASRR